MTDYEENNMPKDLPTGDTLSAKKDIIEQKTNCMYQREQKLKTKYVKCMTNVGGNVLMPCKE